MKHIKLEKLRNGLKNAVSRFFPTMTFLLIAVILYGIDIESAKDSNTIYAYTMLIAAGLCALAQVLSEKYMVNTKGRYFLLIAGVILTILFYLLINSGASYSTVMETRTYVALFTIVMAIIWIPSIGRKVDFNKSFMVVFKGFFIALFYSFILFLGISLIIVATNELLFFINSRIYSHSANIIFILFAPIYFLSLIPVYPGRRENDSTTDEVTIESMSSCPQYLDILISYIIIPITMIFTIILLLYFIQNIGGGFWTDNLLEPMIVSYSITVILVYLLSSSLNNKIVLVFRKVFPKVLIPIVLFQTIASMMKIGEMGLTHGRYYVILYGIFATISGVIFSFLSVKRNGMIATLLIVFSLISIVPPIDAFTISYTSQKKQLEDVLNRNNMFQEDKIISNPNISEEDKKIIVSSVGYLQNMGYSKDIYWLSRGKEQYIDFYQTFGFNEYEGGEGKVEYRYVHLSEDVGIPIQEFDYLFHTNIYATEKDAYMIGEIQHQGVAYEIRKDLLKDDPRIVIQDQEENEIISFSIQEVYNRYEEFSDSNSEMTLKDATFSRENSKVKMEIIIREANIDLINSGKDYNVVMSILIKMK